MAKKFFYVCAGFLCLAIAYQMGASNAGASNEQIVAITSYYVSAEGKAMIWAVTADGSTYGTAFKGTLSTESWKRGANLFGMPIAPPSK